mmetsp:Transcript_9776/g.27344  ORF Transcript_9776/g.27344 Transcript_9776/m.27344 type:complete len:201 (-) Transcript_9776:1432-2034(-)
MFVPKMTFTLPSGAGSKICCCSSRVTMEWSRRTHRLSASELPSRRSASNLISAQPGRKHSTAPTPNSSSAGTSNISGTTFRIVASTSLRNVMSLFSLPHHNELEVTSHDARSTFQGRMPCFAKKASNSLDSHSCGDSLPSRSLRYSVQAWRISSLKLDSCWICSASTALGGSCSTSSSSSWPPCSLPTCERNERKACGVC